MTMPLAPCPVVVALASDDAVAERMAPTELAKSVVSSSVCAIHQDGAGLYAVTDLLEGSAEAAPFKAGDQ